MAMVDAFPFPGYGANRDSASQTWETTLTFTHLMSLACFVVGIGLCVTGSWPAAIGLFAVSTVVEWVGAAVTGKQGNDTER